MHLKKKENDLVLNSISGRSGINYLDDFHRASIDWRMRAIFHWYRCYQAHEMRSVLVGRVIVALILAYRMADRLVQQT